MITQVPEAGKNHPNLKLPHSQNKCPLADFDTYVIVDKLRDFYSVEYMCGLLFCILKTILSQFFFPVLQQTLVKVKGSFVLCISKFSKNTE